MAYTCFVLDPNAAFDPETTRAGVCEAVSTDGLSWRALPAVDGIEGLVMRGREGSWAEHLEASFMVKRGGEYLLHYSGYRNKGFPAQGFPAALAVSRSTDGVHFEPVPDRPILPLTPDWLDNDAVNSPTIVERGGELVMVYAGHCYTRCDSGSGVTLLAATSPDGLVWTKRAEPVLTARSDLGWTRDGVAEPALLLGPDGAWQLFFVGLLDARRLIGVARGPTPFGPWDVDPNPIVVPSTAGFDRAGTFAPDVRLEGVTERMWFLGQTPEEDLAIGYAEAPWPFWTR